MGWTRGHGRGRLGVTLTPIDNAPSQPRPFPFIISLGRGKSRGICIPFYMQCLYQFATGKNHAKNINGDVLAVSVRCINRWHGNCRCLDTVYIGGIGTQGYQVGKRA